MKLSEAIRAGAKLRPQGLGGFFVYDNDGNLCSCALGAAYEAVFHHVARRSETDYTAFEIKFPELNADIEMPDGQVQWIQNAVAKLNDERCWTREQIADWLARKGY